MTQIFFFNVEYLKKKLLHLLRSHNFCTTISKFQRQCLLFQRSNLTSKANALNMRNKLVRTKMLPWARSPEFPLVD